MNIFKKFEKFGGTNPKLWLFFVLVSSITLGLIITFAIIPMVEKWSDSKIQSFDNKWKPLCEELGGLYMEEGYNHGNNCYVNISNILYKTTIIESEQGNYLLGECFILVNEKEKATLLP